MSKINKHPFSKNLVVVLAVALIGMLALPALASAQQLEPTADQYDDTRGAILDLADSGDPGNLGGPGDPGGPSGDSVGSLPFTGLDALGLLLVAVAVAGLGLLLQRVVSRDPDKL